jgi:hypothetical protein
VFARKIKRFSLNLLFTSKTDMLFVKGKVWGFWDG